LDSIHLFNFVKCPICLSIRNDHNFSYKGNIVFSTQHVHDITETTRKRFRLLYTGSNCPHDAHEEAKSLGHILWLMSYWPKDSFVLTQIESMENDLEPTLYSCDHSNLYSS
jgi:hypothetical protein